MTTTQTYELFIRTTPDRLWDAITRPEDTERYFFGTRVALDLHEGADIRYTSGEGHLLVEGKVLAAHPQRELRHTFRALYAEDCAKENSVVTYALEPRGSAVRLTVTHDVSSAPATARNVGINGWSLVLSGLKTLLETGEPLAIGDGAA